jgi:hypothetical protein
MVSKVVILGVSVGGTVAIIIISLIIYNCIKKVIKSKEENINNVKNEKLGIIKGSENKINFNDSKLRGPKLVVDITETNIKSIDVSNLTKPNNDNTNTSSKQEKNQAEYLEVNNQQKSKNINEKAGNYTDDISNESYNDTSNRQLKKGDEEEIIVFNEQKNRISKEDKVSVNGSEISKFKNVIPLMSCYDALSSGVAESNHVKVVQITTKNESKNSKLKFKPKNVVLTTNVQNTDCDKKELVDNSILNIKGLGLELKNHIKHLHYLKQHKDNFDNDKKQVNEIKSKNNINNNYDISEGGFNNKIDENIKKILNYKSRLFSTKKNHFDKILSVDNPEAFNFEIRYSEPEEDESIELEKKIMRNVEARLNDDIALENEQNNQVENIDQVENKLMHTKTLNMPFGNKKKQKKKAFKLDINKLGKNNNYNNKLKTLQNLNLQLKSSDLKEVNVTGGLEDWEQSVITESSEQTRVPTKRKSQTDINNYKNPLNENIDKEALDKKEEKERRNFLVKTVLLQNFVDVPEEDYEDNSSQEEGKGGLSPKATFNDKKLRNTNKKTSQNILIKKTIVSEDNSSNTFNIEVLDQNGDKQDKDKLDKERRDLKLNTINTLNIGNQQHRIIRERELSILGEVINNELEIDNFNDIESKGNKSDFNITEKNQ